MNVFDTGHAVSLLTDDGVELIFHIGIDTIKLQGEGFSPQVKEGQQVKRGETLIEFSLDTITAAGLDPVVMMVVTNGERFSLTPVSNDDKNHNPHIIMTLKESV